MGYVENSINFEKSKETLSYQDIFWIKRDGSRVLVCRAGDLLSHAKLERFPKLESESKVSESLLESISEIFLLLKNAKKPKQKMQTVALVRSHWREWFESEQKLSPLELIILSDRLMGNQMMAHAQTWASASTPLFQRSCLVASLSVMGAVALGYSSWTYLESLWRVSFSYSSQFALEGMSKSSLSCLESARLNLSTVKPPVVTIETFPSLEEMTQLIFENSDGSGVHAKTNYDMNDVERLFVHLNKSTPWAFDLLGDESEWFEQLWQKDDFNVVSKFSDEQVSRNRQTDKNDYLDFEL